MRKQSALTWTVDPPEESGWYWMRSTPCEGSDTEDDNYDAEIALVRGDTETCPKRVLTVDGGRCLLTTFTDLPVYVQWAGPLPFPLETPNKQQGEGNGIRHSKASHVRGIEKADR